MTANRDPLASYQWGLRAVTGHNRQHPSRAATDASLGYFPRVALPTTDSGSNETRGYEGLGSAWRRSLLPGASLAPGERRQWVRVLLLSSGAATLAVWIGRRVPVTTSCRFGCEAKP